MKITMYELLGMIKDGNAPKRILYDNYIWSWTGDDYQTILKDKKEQFLITGMYYTWLTEFLNDTVEILAEEKKIPEKIEMIGCNVKLNILGNEMIVGTDAPLATETCIVKINSIIDYLKSKGE